LGVTTLTFYSALQVAAINDLIAMWLYASVATVTWSLRVFVLVLPPVVGYVTYRLLKGLRISRADRLSHVPLDAVLRPRRYAHRKPERV
jgi:hypothetical protein